MSIKFSDLNLAIPDNKKIISINGVDIEVTTKLPMSDKYDLIMISLQESLDNGIFNDMKLEVAFYTNLIIMCTDIEFSDEQKADKFALFDLLEESDIINKVVACFEDDEYKNLMTYLKAVRDQLEKYNASARALVEETLQAVPAAAEALSEQVNNFNPDKFSEVLDFARNAGMR